MKVRHAIGNENFADEFQKGNKYIKKKTSKDGNKESFQWSIEEK